jgi:hypothetical protein
MEWSFGPQKTRCNIKLWWGYPYREQLDAMQRPVSRTTVLFEAGHHESLKSSIFYFATLCFVIAIERDGSKTKPKWYNDKSDPFQVNANKKTSNIGATILQFTKKP